MPHPNPAPNKLYYGDNLDVLRDYITDESVDLIYLDPPFNSRRLQRPLRRKGRHPLRLPDHGLRGHLGVEHRSRTAPTRRSSKHGGRVAEAMRAFRTFLGGIDMLAYLAMMAPRLIELRRVLKVTGSIYLHCDPTASHYLKTLDGRQSSGQTAL